MPRLSERKGASPPSVSQILRDVPAGRARDWLLRLLTRGEWVRLARHGDGHRGEPGPGGREAGRGEG
jgi:hypothetical protein